MLIKARNNDTASKDFTKKHKTKLEQLEKLIVPVQNLQHLWSKIADKLSLATVDEEVIQEALAPQLTKEEEEEHEWEMEQERQRIKLETIKQEEAANRAKLFKQFGIDLQETLVKGIYNDMF